MWGDPDNEYTSTYIVALCGRTRSNLQIEKLVRPRVSNDQKHNEPTVEGRKSDEKLESINTVTHQRRRFDISYRYRW